MFWVLWFLKGPYGLMEAFWSPYGALWSLMEPDKALEGLKGALWTLMDPYGYDGLNVLDKPVRFSYSNFKDVRDLLRYCDFRIFIPWRAL